MIYETEILDTDEPVDWLHRRNISWLLLWILEVHRGHQEGGGKVNHASIDQVIGAIAFIGAVLVLLFVLL